MKPSELLEALHTLVSECVPRHIWGASGVGKSQIVAQVADELGWQFLDIRAVQLDPVDLRGWPRIANDQAEWVPPKFLPTSGQGILFLDELTSAPQMTQAGCYQLVLDRKLGEYRLPDGWVVMAAGNPASERGLHFSMPRPLRNRFVHLTLEVDFEDWCQWAIRSGIRPEIIAFLRFKPALLHDVDVTSDANAWPAPRSWEMASNVLSGFARRQTSGFFAGTTEIEAQLLEGTVGPAAATELVAFLRLFRQLPSIDEILLNPDSAPLPGEPSAQIAIATALGRVLSDHSISKGARYLDRMPTEMRVLAMRDAEARSRMQYARIAMDGQGIANAGDPGNESFRFRNCFFRPYQITESQMCSRLQHTQKLFRSYLLTGNGAKGALANNRIEGVFIKRKMLCVA